MLGGLLLLAAWLAVLLAARALTRAIGEPRASLAAVAATLVMSTLPALLARWTGDLRLATGLVALAAVAIGLEDRRRSRIVSPPPRDPSDADLEPPLVPAWSLALGALALALVAWTAWEGYFWDENAAHFAVSNALARGLSPPEHPLFPGEPFRYHYAFNVLAGEVRAFTGVGVARAIDVVTIAAFALLLWVSADAGRTLAGRRGAALALILVPLGSGALQHLLFREFGALELRWDALPARWLHSIPPPVISNYFQHPQGLAMPIALGLLLWFEGTERPARPWLRRASGAVLLGLASLAHIVFFGALGLALGVAALTRAVRSRRLRPLVGEGALLALALPIAWALGGFLAPGGDRETLLTFERDFFSEPLGPRLAHHLVLFGVPLLALPLAVRRALRRPHPQASLRAALLAAVTLGLAVPNLMTYTRSWDIVKFLGIAMFFLNLLLADALAPLLPEGPDAPRRGLRIALAAALLALSTSTAWLWLARCSFLDGELGIPKMHFQPPSAISEAVAEALGDRVGPRERVLSTNIELSKGAGFLTPGFDWRAFGSGYMMDRRRVERLTAHLGAARRDLAPADLDALGVSWIVLSPGDLAGLSPVGRAALEDPARFRREPDVRHGGEVRHVWQRRAP